MMIDSRMTARKWLADRNSRARLAVLEELERVGLPSSTDFHVMCIPTLKSWEQVCEIDDEINEIKVLCTFANLPFFAVPSLVNDVDGYVKMLFRKQLRWK